MMIQVGHVQFEHGYFELSLNSNFWPNLCHNIVISCLKCMVNSNTVNSNFHKFKVMLTLVKFKVPLIKRFNSNYAVIQSFNSKYVVIQSFN